MCYRNLGTQHTAYLMNFKKKTQQTFFINHVGWVLKKLVLFAGVTACRDVQSHVAQCPKYLIAFFHFHLDFGNWKKPGVFLLKASVTCMFVLFSSCDLLLIS